MATLFQNLGYNYSDPNGDITEFSANTVEHMEAMPSLIQDWQTEDIATSNVGGYLQNPLGSVSTSIAVSANAIKNIVSTIVTYTNIGVANVMVHIANSSNNLITAATNFKDHTDRVSGAINLSEPAPVTPCITKGALGAVLLIPTLPLACQVITFVSVVASPPLVKAKSNLEFAAIAVE